jgi:hypothetical protein
VKPDLDTLVTVPADPPAAGPDRALDPPPADPGGPAAWALDAGCAADGHDAPALLLCQNTPNLRLAFPLWRGGASWVSLLEDWVVVVHDVTPSYSS